MKHAKASFSFNSLIKSIYLSYIPNKRDNFKQITIKLLFIVAAITFIVSSCFILSYFTTAQKNDNVLENSRTVKKQLIEKAEEEETPSYNQLSGLNEIMLKENSDYKGWITLPGTKIDNPIYQTTNNDFYLNHNQLKKKSVYGALFFDCKNVITTKQVDQNLVVFGHEMKNGSMFGELKKLKNLNFYKQHPTLQFTTLNGTYTYRIYSVFLLNSTKKDDNGYIYNIYKNTFLDEQDFNAWIDEAKQRSIIETGVDVLCEDQILTLVTCSNDFPNARLVVMARKLQWNETEEQALNAHSAILNPNPRHPKLWYDTKGLKYPF